MCMTTVKRSTESGGLHTLIKSSFLVFRQEELILYFIFYIPANERLLKPQMFPGASGEEQTEETLRSL